MAHRILTQIVVTGSRVIGRAAVEAFRHAQAMSAYQKHHGATSGSSGSSNLTGRGSLPLDEAYKILHVKPNVEHEGVLERYKKLFEVNDPKKGGSFYLQSKIHRARERIEAELSKQGKLKEGAAKEAEPKMEPKTEPVKEEGKA